MNHRAKIRFLLWLSGALAILAPLSAHWQAQGGGEECEPGRTIWNSGPGFVRWRVDVERSGPTELNCVLTFWPMRDPALPQGASQDFEFYGGVSAFLQAGLGVHGLSPQEWPRGRYTSALLLLSWSTKTEDPVRTDIFLVQREQISRFTLQYASGDMAFLSFMPALVDMNEDAVEELRLVHESYCGWRPDSSADEMRRSAACQTSFRMPRYLTLEEDPPGLPRLQERTFEFRNFVLFPYFNAAERRLEALNPTSGTVQPEWLEIALVYYYYKTRKGEEELALQFFEKLNLTVSPGPTTGRSVTLSNWIREHRAAILTRGAAHSRIQLAPVAEVRSIAGEPSEGGRLNQTLRSVNI